MAATTFKYLDSLGVVHTQAFDVLSVLGFDRPHKWKLVPPLVHDIVDGSKRTQYVGFQRIFTIELRALNSNEDYIRAFLQAATKSATYQGDNIIAEENHVVFESAEYEDEWFNEFCKTKRYVIELTESTARTIWPTPTSPSVVDIMYFTNNVEITGTYESPQTLTTNSGGLALRENGQAYPAISLLSYKVTVVVQPSYGTEATFGVTNIQQAGANISFQVFMSAGGRARLSDGKFYGNVVIGLETIP